MRNILEHAPKNLLASLWWLGRRFVKEFALRRVERPEERSEQLPEPLPGEILAKHRQFYVEMLLEDQARSQSRSAGDSVEQIN